MQGMNYQVRGQEKPDDILFELKVKIFYMLSAISNCELHFIECIVKRSVLPNISSYAI